MVALSENQSTASDSALVSQVAFALRNYDAAGFGKVRVISHRGTVTLTGHVPNWYSRSLAYQLAVRQPAVSHVVDALVVTQPTRGTSAW
jgi:osmotically-inducible protein OsmY